MGSTRKGPRDAASSKKKSPTKKSTAKTAKTKKAPPRKQLYIARDEITRPTSYLTHHNYENFYRVLATPDAIDVSTCPEDFSEDLDLVPKAEDYTVLANRFEAFKGYWTGYDTSQYAIHGTSILIKEGGKSYVFIGQKIYRFHTDDKITDFVSPMGNNNVPYPVAIGEDNVYFLLDQEFIAKSELKTPATLANAEDLYGEYYGHLGNAEAKKHKMKGVSILNEG
jgi:hypothetical protein